MISSQLLRRISWPAIAGGSVLALAVQAALLLVGWAFRMADSPLGGPWLAVSAAAGFLPGGWLAARTAGIPSRAESAIHGLLAWAAAVVAAVPLAFFFPARPSPAPGTPAAFWLVAAVMAGAGLAGAGGWNGAPLDVIRHPVHRQPNSS